MSSDNHIEQQIQAKGLTAPRITPADIKANILGECYFTAEQGRAAAARQDGGHEIGFYAEGGRANPLELLTFCVLVLRNGFTVTGESACASPENFNAEIGRNVARENAIQKIWPLMGYQLKTALHAHDCTTPHDANAHCTYSGLTEAAKAGAIPPTVMDDADE